jgi:hypothetical protein
MKHEVGSLIKQTVSKMKYEKFDDVDKFIKHTKPFDDVLDEVLSRETEKENIIKAKQFFLEDLESLITSSPNARKDFCLKIADKTALKDFNDYTNFSEAIRTFSRPDTLIELSNFRNNAHSLPMGKIIEKTSQMLDLTVFTKSAAFAKAVHFLFYHLSQIPVKLVNVITHFCQLYEELALVLIEPYLPALLGQSLFLAIILAIHKKGTLKYLFLKVSEKILLYYPLVSALTIIKNYPSNILLHIRKNPFSRTLFCTFTVFSLSYVTFQPATKNKIVLAQKIANNLKVGQGFNNKTLEYSKTIIGKSCFELGQIVSTITGNFASGLFSKYSISLKDIAPSIDKVLSDYFNTKRK